jgi:hypothetical protein
LRDERACIEDVVDGKRHLEATRMSAGAGPLQATATVLMPAAASNISAAGH